MDDFIRLAIHNSVKFALQAIWLIAGMNAGAFVLMLIGGHPKEMTIAFAVGAVLSVVSAIVAFMTMQAEQLAHIANRDWIDARSSPPPNSSDDVVEANRLIAQRGENREKAWRLVADLRLAAVMTVAASLASLIVGLARFFGVW